MIISGGKVFSGAGFDARDVYVEGGVFAEEPIGECSPGQTIDASNCWVIPGLIDVHFHGAMGTTSVTPRLRESPQSPVTKLLRALRLYSRRR